MKFLMKLSLVCFVFTQTAMASPDTIAGTYGLHLFFNETEFVDVLTISPTYTINSFAGYMVVPNDFEGSTSTILVYDKTLEFNLFVPKNLSRPKDLVFHYVGQCFDDSCEQINGFVTIKGENQFLASFLAFKR